VVELGSVLGHSFWLINVSFSMCLDLVKSQLPIVVKEIDEVFIRFKRILWDHQNVHPAMPDCLVLQGGKEDLDPMGFAVEWVAWEHFDHCLVEFCSLWHGIVNDAVIDEWGLAQIGLGLPCLAISGNDLFQ